MTENQYNLKIIVRFSSLDDVSAQEEVTELLSKTGLDRLDGIEVRLLHVHRDRQPENVSFAIKKGENT